MTWVRTQWSCTTTDDVKAYILQQNDPLVSIQIRGNKESLHVYMFSYG